MTMQLDAFSEYGLLKPLSDAGYFPTEKDKRLREQIKKLALEHGCLIAVCGSIGSGKTTFLNKLMQELKAERNCIVSYSFGSDRKKVNTKSLITALYMDLIGGKAGGNGSAFTQVSIPTSLEIRDRKLASLLEENNKPVVLFIDEAHDLQGDTLSSLKKLIEMARISNQILTIIFAGQPKLKNTIQAAALEEVGARSYMIDFDEKGMTQREQYLRWAITQCISVDSVWSDLIEQDALKMLADNFITPLQIIYHFNAAIELALKKSVKPIDRYIIEAVLKKRKANLSSNAALQKTLEKEPDLIEEITKKSVENDASTVLVEDKITVKVKEQHVSEPKASVIIEPVQEESIAPAPAKPSMVQRLSRIIQPVENVD
jgi:type II secretory pathway predicted ATPase ExeA